MLGKGQGRNQDGTYNDETPQPELKVPADTGGVVGPEEWSQAMPVPVMIPGIPASLQAATRVEALAKETQLRESGNQPRPWKYGMRVPDIESPEYAEIIRLNNAENTFLKPAMKALILLGGPGADKLTKLKRQMDMILALDPTKYGSKHNHELAHIKAQMLMICGYNSASSASAHLSNSSNSANAHFTHN